MRQWLNEKVLIKRGLLILSAICDAMLIGTVIGKQAKINELTKDEREKKKLDRHYASLTIEPQIDE